MITIDIVPKTYSKCVSVYRMVFRMKQLPGIRTKERGSLCCFRRTQQMTVNTGAIMLQSHISDMGKNNASAVIAYTHPFLSKRYMIIRLASSVKSTFSFNPNNRMKGASETIAHPSNRKAQFSTDLVWISPCTRKKHIITIVKFPKNWQRKYRNVSGSKNAVDT